MSLRGQLGHQIPLLYCFLFGSGASYQFDIPGLPPQGRVFQAPDWLAEVWRSFKPCCECLSRSIWGPKFSLAHLYPKYPPFSRWSGLMMIVLFRDHWLYRVVVIIPWKVCKHPTAWNFLQIEKLMDADVQLDAYPVFFRVCDATFLLWSSVSLNLVTSS